MSMMNDAEDRDQLIRRKIKAVLDASGRTPLNMIEVRSGAFVDPLDIDPELVFIEDVAFALSHSARFSGHTGTRGAEHALIVEDLLSDWGTTPRVRLLGLLHDAHEAYLVDIPKPMKRQPEFAFYRAACDRAQQRILESVGVSLPTVSEEAIVKRADVVSLIIEAQRGLPSRGEIWPKAYANDEARLVVASLDDYIGQGYENWKPMTLCMVFLSRYRQLRALMIEGESRQEGATT